MTHLEHVTKESLKLTVEKIFELSWVKVMIVSFGTVWASLFNGQKEIMTIIPLMIILDTITGFSAAWMNHNVKSSFYYRSPLKAAIYFIFIITARAVDMFAPGDYFTTTMSFFIVSTEAISILENAHKMGFDAPTSILKRLRDYRPKK